MPLLLIGLLWIRMADNAPAWLSLGFLGIAVVEVLSLGLGGGVFRRYPFALSRRQKARVKSAGLFLWLIAAVLSLVAGWALERYAGWDGALFAAILGGAAVFFEMGIAFLRGSGKKITARVLTVLGVAAMTFSPYYWEGECAVLGLAASLCLSGLVCMLLDGGIGRLAREDLSGLVVSGRPCWFYWLLAGVPAALLARRADCAYCLVALALLIPMARSGRRDAEGAAHLLGRAMMLMGAALTALSFSRWFLDRLHPWGAVMGVWILAVAFIPTVDSRYARRSLGVLVILAMMALTSFLPLPSGGLLAAVLYVLMLLLFLPLTRTAYLPIRAWWIRRRFRIGK